ncbi:hypothetical protein TWF696_002073 [Orbilia brochopaga]|uniref:Uncharacterized protein n=1 Tax=Orbilia brochopaga TaxID=3140254 RepID=A0AAV9UAN6_9PEZI
MDARTTVKSKAADDTINPGVGVLSEGADEEEATAPAIKREKPARKRQEAVAKLRINKKLIWGPSQIQIAASASGEE